VDALQTIGPLEGTDSPSLAARLPRGPSQTARTGPGQEGRPSRAPRCSLLSLSKLVRTGRELDERSNHALLSDMRRKTGDRSPTARDR
jgi:hypothetical protein